MGTHLLFLPFFRGSGKVQKACWGLRPQTPVNVIKM